MNRVLSSIKNYIHPVVLFIGLGWLCSTFTSAVFAQGLPQSRLKGEEFYEQGNYLKALQEFDKYEKHSQAELDEMYLHRKAEVLYLLGLFDEALSCYARVLETDSSFTNYEFFWGLMMRSSDPTAYYDLEGLKDYASGASTFWMNRPARFNVKPFYAVNSKFSEFGAIDYKGQTFFSTNAGWVGSARSAELENTPYLQIQQPGENLVLPDTSEIYQDDNITFYYNNKQPVTPTTKKTKLKKHNRDKRKLASKDINTQLTYFDIYSVNTIDARSIEDFGGRFFNRLAGDEKNFLKEEVESLPLVRYANLNTRFNDGPIAFYGDNKLMVTSNEKHKKRLENYFNLNLYEADIAQDGNVSKPQKTCFGKYFEKNSVGHITFSPDGQHACMVVKLKDSDTGSDLYFSNKLANGEWSEPEHGGKLINSERDEQFPFWGKDGFIYYSSDGFPGNGGLDIYQIDPFKVGAEPQNLGTGINSPYDDFSFWMDSVGRGYLASNRKGGQGKDDIYTFQMLQGAVKIVLLCDTVWATEPWFELKNRLGKSMGKFNIQEYPKKVFSRLPYDDYQVNHLFPADSVYQKIELYQDTVYVYVDFPRADTLQVRFTNFCFDCDQRTEIEQERFNRLVEFLHQFPELKVVIKGNTDQFGTDEYNQKLGMRRANSMEKWLLDAGVSNMLEKVSLGKSATVSRTDHRLNRRVDIELYWPDSSELLTSINKDDPRLERDLIIHYDEPVQFDTELKEGFYLQIYRSNRYMNKAICAEKYGLGDQTKILLFSDKWNEFNYYINVPFESERAARDYANENGLKAKIMYLR